MRIWSFQDKDSLAVLKDFIWNKFSFQQNSTLQEDMQYARSVNVKNSQGDIVQAERLPVYGYAKMKSDSDKILCLRVFLQQYEYLFNIYGQNLLNKVMFELEVPEKDMILLRSTDEISDKAYNNYLKCVRITSDDSVYEVLLPEIRKEYIASYYLFNAMHQPNGVMVSSNIVNNSLSPMYTGIVYITDDSKVYYNDDVGNIVSSNAFNIDDLVGNLGPSSCPEYLTIAEALRYCNFKYQDEIVRLCKKFGIFKSHYDSITIADINNKNKTSSSIDELFGGIKANK